MSTSVPSVKGNASNHLVKLSTSDNRSLHKLDYLDLAGVYTRHREWRGFQCLDLAVVVPRFEQAFFLVRHGRRIFINRAVLKSHGPADSMVLFSLFPVELRQKIYDHALVREEEVFSKVVDNGTGKWVSKGYVEPNYSLMASNTEAHDYLSTKYGYILLYKDGITMFSPKVDRHVKLTVVGGTANPSLQIAPMFAKHFDMANIGSLVFEIPGLNNDNAARWIRSNLAGMTNLKSLALHCFCKISLPEQSEVSFQVISKSPHGRNRGYTHVLFTKNGQGYDTYENAYAQNKICTLVLKQEEQQGIMDIWMTLTRCLKDEHTFPTFPNAVIMSFHWKY